jgi:SAM-dependent methyltransferase/glycosyltransferase involved in cell wall biosynthesis
MIILVLVNMYLPGYKAGGPLQSVANMTERLGEGFQIRIITTDRDYGDSQPYPSVRSGEWQQIGKAQVLYVRPGDCSIWNLRRIINGTEYDVLYLNSLFNPVFTLRPLLLWQTGMLCSTPLVIAPRGEFSPGALQIKNLRKRFYLGVAGVVHLYRGVLWQASSAQEEAEIRQGFPGGFVGGEIAVVAPDLPSRGIVKESGGKREEKRRGHLRLLFASRISPKKNLAGALRCLDGLQGEVDFDICGPVDDEAYWVACQRTIAGLPDNVNVSYCGPMPHEQLMQEMARHDLFFLPTLGENFCHAIVEALRAGCPVLISDQTPWRNLESKCAGWDLPTEGVSSFREVMQRCVGMDDQEHQRWRDGAERLAQAVVHDDATVAKNRDLFVRALRYGAFSGRKRGRSVLGTSTDERRSHFDGMADFWETKYEPGGPLEQRTISFVRCLRDSVDARGQVLDFGCGSGDIAIACRNAGYRMSGIDLSSAMIARARLRSNGHGIGFDVLESDEPLNLPYSEARFDAVIASSVLEYVHDPLECFKELWRVCKPDGVLIATVPNLCHPRRWLELALRRSPIRKWLAAQNGWRVYGEYLRISGNRLRRKDWSNLLGLAGWRLETMRARSTSLVILVAKRVGFGPVHGERDGLSDAADVLQAQNETSLAKHKNRNARNSRGALPRHPAGRSFGSDTSDADIAGDRADVAGIWEGWLD